ncbi:hypothetical protein MXL20_12785 [Staphylococcus pseudoxylosus]|nr:hypothetical protein [Staphylococcus pseudoxylosus]MEB6333854.1 hypothetical protein [Staphylococcus pseudoxylosus]
MYKIGDASVGFLVKNSMPMLKGVRDEVGSNPATAHMYKDHQCISG